ncbi:MAG TPA: DUF5011 domain-containing protein [Candidatus Scybalousia intestinigallinarum]|nr:DUF5011 domain-containing protein [Candidatus Scybalousia intestinigallinarum]
MKKVKAWFLSNKYLKAVGILIAISLFLFLLGYLLWVFWLSKIEIFKQEEQTFLDAVKRYYEYRQELLPAKGESREISLEKMFLEDRVEALYVPKTKTLCDTSSWVRVVQTEEGEYQYYTYLKCGKYESDIDHEGPKIELNGEENMIISQNTTFEDPGVKKVTDNVDGEIDISKVTVDTSKVDTSKVGVYEVTYKAKDSTYNQTKATRTVTVARNFSETVASETDESNYYKGQVADNYVQFSGMLWRIINVDENGNVKLISEDVVSNLRYDSAGYKDSNVETWLNNVFYNSLTNPDKYLVDTTYCIGAVNSVDDINNSCSETITAKVGLPSLDEYYKTVENGYSAMNYQNNYEILLANKVNNDNLIVTMQRTTGTTNSLNLPPIKPVITIKNGFYIYEGDGTKEKPYKLNDYQYGEEHEQIKNRLVGEYISYSGQLFRIIGQEKDGSVKVIGAHPLLNISTDNVLMVSVAGIPNYQYNLTDENNPGYIINEDYIEYLDDSNIIPYEYEIITNSPSTKYNELESETVNAKLMLASTIDLFSGVTNSNYSSQRVQLFSDRSTGENTVIMLNVVTGVSYELTSDNFSEFSIKVVTHLNGNLKIRSGKGTMNDPYLLQ